MPTVTNVEAQSAIIAHHAELQASLRERVLALRVEVQAGRSHTDPQRAAAWPAMPARPAPS